MGGLGLHSLKDINTALLSKWGWRYKTERDNLWVGVISAIHSGGSNWDFVPLKKSLGDVWCNIVATIKRPILDGSSICNLFKGVVRGDGLWLWRHDPVTTSERTEWNSLISALDAVNLSIGADKWLWVGNGSECFSVKAVKKIIDLKNDYSSRYVMDWCKWVPLKCNILVWRAEMDRIPTVEALVRRGMPISDGECKYCEVGPDSVVHLFTTYPLALGLWEKISLWCRVMNFYVFSFRDLLEIQEQGRRRVSERKALHGITIAACWFLWKARNNLRFNGKRSNGEEVGFYDL
ncbi:uncharacterized protein LOC118480930 [Helianthus annuus]|uniref:uncharacterized protein LOC118480930 n=1 Tax=Helianthus annuus TaxID=4232 RepID=UPI001653392C|nr:uncharacterized protein LOC118480930 [Helianthus annuus]